MDTFPSLIAELDQYFLVSINRDLLVDWPLEGRGLLGMVKINIKMGRQEDLDFYQSIGIYMSNGDSGVEHIHILDIKAVSFHHTEVDCI